MWSTGINRNIVECKDDLKTAVEEALQVLIETLWNVKIGLFEAIRFAECINRNIVECKVGYIFRGILSGCTY